MRAFLSGKVVLSALQQYMVVTAAYWAFTLSDGALRMLVVFHFHQLGYSTLEIAGLFLFYEFFGILTNLYGGWLGARFGLRLTLWAGMALQIVALLLLVPVSASWPKLVSVLYVMAAQAISGIAKDLSKMSAKSAIKTVVVSSQPSAPGGAGAIQGEQRLFQWVAVLTGSKNALKGLGFFAGGLLLAAVGFAGSVATLAALLALARCSKNRLSLSCFARVKPSIASLWPASFYSGRGMFGLWSPCRCFSKPLWAGAFGRWAALWDSG